MDLSFLPLLAATDAPGHLGVPQFLVLLVVMLGAARLCGLLAKSIGQPSVLGELIAGVILGPSLLGLLDPQLEVVHLLAEVGVIILLLLIGLETDLKQLLAVGGTSTAVAAVGVIAPFVLGYAVCRLLGMDNLVSIVAGAALTATSVGITARVLSDLGRLQEPESQIVLGAAVVDDIVGLIILTVVSGIAQGNGITPIGIARITAIAFGFLVLALLLGRYIVPPLVRLSGKSSMPGNDTILALVLTFGLAWVASQVGSAVIIGAFAAGLLLRMTHKARDIEHGITELGHFFVPIFFVAVGAAVDVRVFNPLDPANHPTLILGSALVLVAVFGKFISGYAAPWFRGNKKVIGVGMIPRGEVGLIFAQMGLSTRVFDAKLFSAVALMVMVTTFLAPPLLRMLFPPQSAGFTPPPPEGVEELVGGE